MPDSVLLVDFGASRVKSVAWSFSRNAVLASRECPAPTLRRGPHGEAEGEPEHYWQALEATAGVLLADHRFHRSHRPITDLFLCAEMHGFLLADPQAPRALTPYFSWQDQRANQPALAGQPSTLQRLSPSSPLLLREAGMRLRAGLPILTLAHLQEIDSLPAPSRLLTLADWLLVRGGEATPHTHPTLAAGTGLYALDAGDWSPDLLREAGLSTTALQMPAIQHNDSTPLGTIDLAGCRVRVWGGWGDLQAAACGAGFPALGGTLVNLGTGSQVLVHAAARSAHLETRPCATGGVAHAVTHIPAGRALNTFAAFFDDCARHAGGQPFFWQRFGNLCAQEVLAAQPCVDLTVFEAAWRFVDGGSIRGIREGHFDVQGTLCAIALSWLEQYPQALRDLGTSQSHPGTNVLLGGGLPRRCPFVPEVLSTLLGTTCSMAPLHTGEETLDGLLNLAQRTVSQISAHSSE